jgi:hypothetical protein
MGNRPDIFISTTSADLAKARETVSEALLDAHCHHLVQEHFPVSAGNIRLRENSTIQECQAVIHIAGLVYGSEPQPSMNPRRSYTQLEYDAATQHKRPIYLFFPTEKFYEEPSNLPAGFTFSEPEEKKVLQRSHQARLRAGNDVWHEFSNLEELREKVLRLAEREDHWKRLIKDERKIPSRLAAIVVMSISLCAALLFWKMDHEGDKTREMLLELSQHPNRKLEDVSEKRGLSQEQAVQDITEFKARVDSDINATPEDRKLSEVAGKFVLAGFTPEQFKNYVQQLHFDDWKPSFVVLHHTASPLDKWEKSPKRGLRSFHDFITQSHNWKGGPHLFIDREKIWVLNRLTEPGIHARA